MPAASADRRARAGGRPGRGLRVRTAGAADDPDGDQSSRAMRRCGRSSRRARSRWTWSQAGELGVDDGALAAAAGSRRRGLSPPDRGGGAEMIDGGRRRVAARIAEIVRERMAGWRRAGHRRGAARRAARRVAGADRRGAGGQGRCRRAASRSRSSTPSPARFADRLAADGVDEVLTVTTPTEHFEAHVASARSSELIEAESPALVLLGHTIDSLGFAPAVAAARRARVRDRCHRGAVGRTARSRRAAPTATSSSPSSSSRARRRTVLLLRAGTFEPADASGAAPATRTRRARARRRRRRPSTSASRRPRPATSTSRRRRSCCRSAAASRTRTTSRASRSWPSRLGATLSVLAAAGRRRLDAERPPGRPVGQDRQAARLPRAGDLRRGPASGRDADGGDDHRGQHRSGGADLRRRALRGGGGHVRARRRARAGSSDSARHAARAGGSVKTRPVSGTSCRG